MFIELRKKEYEKLLQTDPIEAEKFHMENKLDYIFDHNITEGSNEYNDVINDKIDIYDPDKAIKGESFEKYILRLCGNRFDNVGDVLELGCKIIDKGIEDRQTMLKILRGELNLDDAEKTIYYLKGCDIMKEYPKEALDAIHKEIDKCVANPEYYYLLEVAKELYKYECELDGIPCDNIDDIE